MCFISWENDIEKRENHAERRTGQRGKRNGLGERYGYGYGSKWENREKEGKEDVW